MKRLLLFFVSTILCISGMNAETWKKVTAPLTDWTGTYLLVSETSNVAMNGALSGDTNSGTLQNSGNYVSVAISEGTITTADASMAFSVTPSTLVPSQYHVASASGWYIGNNSSMNGIQTSATATLINTFMLTAQGVAIMSEDYNILSIGGTNKKVMYRQSPEDYLVLYKLEGKLNPPSPKEMHTITVTEDKGIIYITPDDSKVDYAYYVLNSTEYQKHINVGRTTANQIFDAEVALLETSDVHKGETTIKVSDLQPNGDWYIVAACVNGVDNGSFVQYSRFSDGDAFGLNINNVPFVGCKWAKGKAPWAGTYLLVAEDTEACLNGSLSGDPNTGSLQSTGNFKGTSIFGGEIETDNKAMSFTIEAIEGGYAIKSASGWYIGGVNGKNGIATSATPLLNSIAEDGTITSEGNILSLAVGKIMYRATASEKVIPYTLTLDTTTEPADYSKATYTIAVDGDAKTATITSSMEDAKFGYIIISNDDYKTHVAAGRTTANDIFDAESAMLRGTNVKTGSYTIDLSTLEEGRYYIVAAGVEAEDQIFRTVYNRISEAADAKYSTTPEGCVWTKVSTPVLNWAGTYMIVAENSKVAINGALSGDANTGALQSSMNYIPVEIKNNTILTADASQAFTIETVKGGYSIRSASGWYIGGKRNGDAGIATSETAIVNLISSNGTTMNDRGEKTLCYASDKFMYRATAEEGVTYYILTSNNTEETPDYSKATMSLSIDEVAKTANMSTSMEGAQYASFILSETEYNTHVTAGRTTADQIFDAEAALLETSDIHTGNYSADLSKLGEGIHYIVAAIVKGEDLGTFTKYTRTSATAAATYDTTPFEGCKWAKATGELTAGKYLLVAEQSELVMDGALSGDANTGALISALNYVQTPFTNNTIRTANKAQAFDLEVLTNGYALKSASGWYIGAKAGLNGIIASKDALVNNIDANGTITSRDRILSFGGQNIMYREMDKVTERVVLYTLLSDTSKEPADYSKTQLTLNVDEVAKTATITTDIEDAQYAYFVYNESEYNAHIKAGRTTANQIFDADAATIYAENLCTGTTTIDLSKYAEGTYYFCAAVVEGEDLGTFTKYNRLTEAQHAIYTTNFEGCVWAKATEIAAGEKYLLVAEQSSKVLNGSLSGNAQTGALQSTGNAADFSFTNNTIHTADKAMSFTIEAINGGYAIKSASGWYIGAGTQPNSIATSEAPMLNTIDAQGRIASKGRFLSFANNKIMYREDAEEPVVLYALLSDTSKEPADYSKATYTISIDKLTKTATITSSIEEAEYTYIRLTQEEYDAHVKAGRATANQIFDAEASNIYTENICTGTTNIDLSKLAEKDYYFIAAGVQGTDNGSFVQYSRLTDATMAQYLNAPFEGCEWAKATTLTAGQKYILVAEQSQVIMNGALSGDAQTGALTSTGNYTAGTFASNIVRTTDKAMSFTLEAINGGYALKSASGYYIGGKKGINGITTSESALLNTIAADGTITSEGNILSFANNKIMYREDAEERVVLYTLLSDNSKEPEEIPATATVSMDITENGITFTPSVESMGYTFVIRTEMEHEADMLKGMTIDNVFDTYVRLVDADKYLTGVQTVSFESLNLLAGTYYIYVAGVEAEDMGGWYNFTRIATTTENTFNWVGAGIGQITINTESTDAIFNLQGQKIQSLQRGLNIRGGKKILR